MVQQHIFRILDIILKSHNRSKATAETAYSGEKLNYDVLIDLWLLLLLYHQGHFTTIIPCPRGHTYHFKVKNYSGDGLRTSDEELLSLLSTDLTVIWILVALHEFKS